MKKAKSVVIEFERAKPEKKTYYRVTGFDCDKVESRNASIPPWGWDTSELAAIKNRIKEQKQDIKFAKENLVSLAKLLKKCSRKGRGSR